MIGLSEVYDIPKVVIRKETEIKVSYPHPKQNVLGLMAYGIFIAINFFGGVVNLTTSVSSSLTGFACGFLYIAVYQNFFRFPLESFPRISTVVLILFSFAIALSEFPKIL